MNKNYLTRTAALLGDAAIKRLSRASVLVAGLGGVGGYVVEALARTGVEELWLCDCDEVAESNVNRQIVALPENVGRRKTEVAAERVRAINPEAKIHCLDLFLTPENVRSVISDASPDFVADAIDNVSAKLELAVVCRELGIPLVSSMGTGNKLDPTRLQITDISKTHTCPLARVMRRELKARGIAHLDVLFSDEPPIAPRTELLGSERVPASAIFVPAAAGLTIAAHIVSRLIEEK